MSDLTENLKAMQAQRKEKETEINAKGDILKGLNKNIEELWKVAAFYNLFLLYCWVLAALARPCTARNRIFRLSDRQSGALRAPCPAHRSFADPSGDTKYEKSAKIDVLLFF